MKMQGSMITVHGDKSAHRDIHIDALCGIWNLVDSLVKGIIIGEIRAISLGTLLGRMNIQKIAMYSHATKTITVVQSSSSFLPYSGRVSRHSTL
jgi:hypothetical protein